MRRAVVLAVVLILASVACASSQTRDADVGGGRPAATTGTSSAPAPGTTAPAGKVSERYADMALWHCHPAKTDDLCAAAELGATVIGPAGNEPATDPPAAAVPPIDCFYVYPTVDSTSSAPSRTFDQPVNPIEAIVIQATFAPYGPLCRRFAPRYEQVTGAGYRSAQAVEVMATASAQVEEAFDHYLATENHGRPFVLIGHSQGTHHLVKLIQDRLDGPAGEARRRQLVSALLLGPVGLVAVSKGQAVGGTFSTVPLCRAKDQVGCVVAYDSYAEGYPPVALPARADKERVCTNPADLTAGDRLVPLSGPRFSRSTAGVTTPFEIWPGHFAARCALDSAGEPFLEISAQAGADPRAGALLARSGAINLHVLDPNFAMGDLLALVATQSAAATARR